MDVVETLGDLLEHLERTTGLDRTEARRVIDEILTYFSEPVEGFVVRRHAELQEERLKNEEIFDRIRTELEQRRFAAPGMTTRQIRRLVYG